MPRHRSPRILLLLGLVLAFRGGLAGAAGDGGSIWGVDYFPNVPLVTHEGKPVRFFDDVIKGKVVVINFIYTSCPDACPLETARLREVQKILGDRVGRDVFMYSITIDPKVDTPEVLKHYAEKFQVGPGWLFLTGKEADITLLRRKLGLYGEEDQSPESIKDHSLTLIIGNQSTGQWMKSSPYENPYVLATQVGSWLHNWKLPPKEKRDYASAPEIRNISKAETLFRTRCAACHTIGSETVGGPEKQPLGPDLFGVTQRRDRAWLTRWLAEPDKMLAEQDPLALSLLAAYNNVAMPNLRLGSAEIEDLLTFIDEETRRKGHHDHDHGGEHHDPGEHP
jgi:protein SCO1/2